MFWPTNLICNTCNKKRYWSPECSKKRKSKTAKPSSPVNIVIDSVLLSNSWKIGCILIVTLSKSIKGILLDCVATFHIFIFFNCQFFISYNYLTDSEYITVSSQYKVLVERIVSAYLTIILPHSISILTLLNILHMLTLCTNLVSLGIIQCKEITVRSDKKRLIISKNDNDLFLAIFRGFSISDPIW